MIAMSYALGDRSEPKVDEIRGNEALNGEESAPHAADSHNVGDGSDFFHDICSPPHLSVRPRGHRGRRPVPGDRIAIMARGVHRVSMMVVPRGFSSRGRIATMRVPTRTGLHSSS